MGDAQKDLPEPAGFDREFTIEELVCGGDRVGLAKGLAALLGTAVRLVGSDAGVVAGDPDFEAAARIPVTHEIETVGYLETEQDPGPLGQAAAAVVEMFMRSTARYLMASDLHLQTVKADYQELEHRHEALKASESRYRALSQELEQRVEEQVSTIDTAHRRLYQSEKMAAVGQLAAGVAHEINNPLGFIRSNLSTAQSYVRTLGEIGRLVGQGESNRLGERWREVQADEMLEDFAFLLTESTDGAERIADIVRDLKGFSNVDLAEEEVVELNDCVRRVCNIANAQIDGSAELVFEPGAVPPILCRPAHISQVFLNLVLNAAQAVAGGGRIEVRSFSAGDERIAVEVSDDGEGIPAGVKDKVFDPFFTTRAVGTGTGLGLTVSRDIVQAHGGEIQVESEPGAGTTVTVHLPLRKGAADAGGRVARS